MNVDLFFNISRTDHSTLDIISDYLGALFSLQIGQSLVFDVTNQVIQRSFFHSVFTRLWITT